MPKPFRPFNNQTAPPAPAAVRVPAVDPTPASTTVRPFTPSGGPPRLPRVEPIYCPCCARGMTPTVTHRVEFTRYCKCDMCLGRFRIDYDRETLAPLRAVKVAAIPKGTPEAKS